jgi:serine/threonine protein phosphatase PrpC
MIPKLKNENIIKPKSFYSLFFISPKTENSNFIKNIKHNIKYHSKESNQKRNIDESLLSKSKISKNNSFNISLNNSLLIGMNKKNKKFNKDLIQISINSNNDSKPNIISLKRNFKKDESIFSKKAKDNKYINKSFNYNDNIIKIENMYNGINIVNKTIIPTTKNSNHNSYIKHLLRKNNSNNINDNFYNMNNLDHIFNKSKKYKSPLSSNLNNIHFNRLAHNLLSNNKTIPVNNESSQNNIQTKKNKNHSYNNRNNYNNSLMEKSNQLILENRKNSNMDSNIKYEKNYIKRANRNNFQPKNIFSKFKTKKNYKQNSNLKNRILVNNQKNLPNYNIFIKKADNESIMEKANHINNKKSKEESHKNNHKLNKKNGAYIQKIKPYNQFLNSSLLSSTTFNTGTDNLINSTSQNNIEFNINSGNTSINYTINKTKKISCIHDISKTGLSGEEKKVNQDRYFIFRNFVSGFDNIFMGVCDGHGYYGHEVSEYIKENLPMDLNRVLKTKKLNLLKDDLSQVIKQTFEMENNSLLRNKQIDSNLSGSTCVSVIYTPYKLITANLGDSRCVLGKKIKGKWKAENLTRDHKPSLPEEAERIKSYGGRIRPMKDEDGNYIGPLRVYMKEKDIPGLAMTRSFGDYYASTAGTIPIPEVKEYKFEDVDKFMILASDGLFEFIDSDEVVKIVSKYYEKNDIVGCCEFLYKESYRKWIYEEEDTVDDITIILVFFEN